MIFRKVREEERYIGVDFGDDGSLVVAERQDGRGAGTQHYPAGSAGIAALRAHISAQPGHPHVCVRACGAAALAVMVALVALPDIEVTLISPRALESGRPGVPAATLDADQRAERLARRAERLF
jgi:hypothetical protein